MNCYRDTVSIAWSSSYSPSDLIIGQYVPLRIDTEIAQFGTLCAKRKYEDDKTKVQIRKSMKKKNRKSRP
jgi:hypothetical protein